jgi:hypothetical protein
VTLKRDLVERPDDFQCADVKPFLATRTHGHDRTSGGDLDVALRDGALAGLGALGRPAARRTPAGRRAPGQRQFPRHGQRAPETSRDAVLSARLPRARHRVSGRGARLPGRAGRDPTRDRAELPRRTRGCRPQARDGPGRFPPAPHRRRR